MTRHRDARVYTARTAFRSASRNIRSHVRGHAVIPIRGGGLAGRGAVGLNSGIQPIVRQLGVVYNQIAIAKQRARTARAGVEKANWWRRVHGLRMHIDELREMRDYLMDDDVAEFMDQQEAQHGVLPPDVRDEWGPPPYEDTN